ncbi:MAG: type IV toxin-antitoxin system AbiEi family antitoxin domain-containing protein [Candidatus Xenobia bacterium]
MPHQHVRDYVLSLQAAGRYCFTSADVARAIGGTAVAREAALRRLRQKTRIVTVRRGFHVVVPVEYHTAGAPPASWFIDPLMRHLKRPYYVGLLTAAALHGASHQQPQAFQVVTDVPMRPIQAGRVRIEFHRNRNLGDVCIREVKTETGSMRVATPEATALDVVHFARAAGHLDNVATVIRELAETMAPRELHKASAAASRADVQRLGFLLETLGLERLAEALARRVATWRRRPVMLQPEKGKPHRLRPDARWFVLPNVPVVPDL